MHLIKPTSGMIVFEGQDATSPTPETLRALRRTIQIIFQDPFSSLDPRQKIADIIREPLDIHRIGTPVERRQRVRELMERVALAQSYANRYPHELSGGLRQRVGIATALALGPQLIVADEPTSALDASVQAEILNLLADLQRDIGMAYLFISHNLDAVRFLSQRVGVMYLGKIVELGPADVVYRSPQHPYTRALLSDIPVPDPTVKQHPMPMSGEVPSPIDVPPGCPFHTRCWLAQDICKTVVPPLLEYEPGHVAACHVTAAERGLGAATQLRRVDVGEPA
jgi:oligopeptide/dipeptide ABC transporter ATP-binding protein